MKIGYFLLTLIYFVSFMAQAARIEIRQGEFKPDPIAITSLVDSLGNPSPLGLSISGVIAQDLESSGLFLPISQSQFPQSLMEINQRNIKFSEWRSKNARFLMIGKIHGSGGSITVDFKLFDVLTGQQMIAFSVSGEANKWRRIAHIIADMIYSRITNEAGFFNTHIVYIEPYGQGRQRRSRIIRMDRDGENAHILADASDLVLTPRYSPSGNYITYLRIHNHSAEVYVMNLLDKSHHKLGQFPGMTYAPRFSPDGKSIVMSHVKNGLSAIYLMDLQTHQLRALTDHKSIDTSPCFSPDGKQIVFTSDRAGKEHLYIMNAQGGEVRRISFGEGKYSQPVWSPRGDLIAFTKQIGNQFYIGVISPDGSGERMIASGWLVEAPCWANNGRYLIFTKEEKHGDTKTSFLHMVDLTGQVIRKIKSRTHAFDCAWSPSLK